MKLTAEPQLFVTDMQAALQHYTDSLGFTVALVWGEPAFYAQVVRDGAKLNLRHVDGPVFSEALRQAEGEVLSATVTTDDIEGLYAEIADMGVTFHQTLRTEPWGARTFIVADPSGNLILFAGA
ncbi:VOC family protein [Brevundimonas sp. BR2-1]|uniref:VOC family protein n=1 Tax=Brevundimonas sp. BR2-1 TaxID=3031123 RepID=UPI00309580C7